MTDESILVLLDGSDLAAIPTAEPIPDAVHGCAKSNRPPPPLGR